MKLKFRAWDKRRKCMIEVTSISFRDGTIQEDTRYAVNRKIYLDDVVLMQYTGLKDKNGVGIYEGDYIDCKWDSDDWSGVVEFIEGSFCTNPLSDSKFPSIINECNSIKVIGNIYENPELLKEQNK